MNPGPRLESPHGRLRCMRPECPQGFAHDRVVALKTQPAQRLMQAHRRQVGAALQQLLDLIRKRVQQARPPRPLLFHRAGPAILVSRQHAAHTLAIDSQQAWQSAAARCRHSAAGQSRCGWTRSCRLQFADEVLAQRRHRSRIPRQPLEAEGGGAGHAFFARAAPAPKPIPRHAGRHASRTAAAATAAGARSIRSKPGRSQQPSR
jgi:hypothetical protein